MWGCAPDTTVVFGAREVASRGSTKSPLGGIAESPMTLSGSVLQRATGYGPALVLDEGWRSRKAVCGYPETGAGARTSSS